MKRVVILTMHVKVWAVFRDVCQFWKVHTKFPKLKRSSSDIQSPETASAPGPVLATSLNGRPPLAAMLGKETLVDLLLLKTSYVAFLRRY